MPPRTPMRVFGKTATVVGEVVPPLGPVIDLAASTVGESSRMSDTREKLREDLALTTNELANWQDSLEGTGSKRTLKRTIDGLGDLAAQTGERYKRSRMGRLMGVQNEAEDIVEHRRDMDQHLHRFERNVSLNHWSDSREHHADNRLKSLNPALSACYDSSAATTVHRRACTPGTRKNILDDLHAWTNDINGPSLYWMNGMAGTGKTTIAYSFCTALAQDCRPAVSFFCSRLLLECRDITRIVATLAYQLARYLPLFSAELSEVMRRDPDIGTRGMDKQFDALIRTPLLKVQHIIPNTPVLVIDALDECSDTDGTEQLVDLFLGALSYMRVKVFVSCRPHAVLLDRLRTAQSHIGSVLHLHDIEESLVQADIETYLHEALARFKVSRNDVTKLARRSGKLFIHAATVVRYVLQTKGPYGSRQRLERVLNDASHSSASPYRELDALYRMILEAAMDNEQADLEERENVWLVLCTVLCLREPMNASTLANLFGWRSEMDAYAALEPLYSVLHLSTEQQVIATLHASFSDFMFNADRSGRFYLSLPIHHTFLARRCLDLMQQSLRYNICELESSFMLDSEMPGLHSRVERMISPELGYICRYWSHHLCSAGVPDELVGSVDRFMKTQVLHWMETMNLIGSIGHGTQALAAAHSWTQVSQWVVCTFDHELTQLQQHAECDLHKLTEEAYRYVTVFAANPISESTPHVYVSARALQKPDGHMIRYYGMQMHDVADESRAVLDWNQTGLLATWKPHDSVGCVAFSRDGARVAAGLGDGSVVIYEMPAGRVVSKSVCRHKFMVESIVFSHDGGCVVSCSSDDTVRVWDACTGQTLADQLKPEVEGLKSIVVSRDGRLIAAFGDTSIWIRDRCTEHTSVDPLETLGDPIVSSYFSADGSRIIYSTFPNKIIVWDVLGRCAILGPLSTPGVISSVALSHDGSRFVHGTLGGTVYISDVRNGQTLARLVGHTDCVVSVTFSSNDTRVTSGSQDQTVRVWDAHTELSLAIFGGQKGRVNSVVFSHDGSRVLAGCEGSAIHVWDAYTEHTHASSYSDYTCQVTSFALSDDGSRIVSGSSDYTVRVWDAYTGRLVTAALTGHTDRVNCITFSRDGSWVVSGSADHTARVWNVNVGHMLVGPILNHEDGVELVAYSGNGNRIASYSSDGKIRLWDAQTECQLSCFAIPLFPPIDRVAFSDDLGRAISNNGLMIRMWNTLTGYKLRELWLLDLIDLKFSAFSSDRRRVVCGAFDGRVFVWDTRTEELPPKRLFGHQKQVVSVAFAQDGTRLMSASEDGVIYVWDADTGCVVAGPFGSYASQIRTVAFSKNGSRCLFQTKDDRLRVWDISTSLPATWHHQWTIDADGWIRGPNAERLLWLPPSSHELLLYPGNTTMIHPKGWLKLNFENANIGPRWTQKSTA